MKRITTRMLVTLALLSALEVVLARFIVPMPNPTMRFSIEHVPIILAGLLFGPVPGMVVGFVVYIILSKALDKTLNKNATGKAE